MNQGMVDCDFIGHHRFLSSLKIGFGKKIVCFQLHTIEMLVAKINADSTCRWHHWTQLLMAW